MRISWTLVLPDKTLQSELNKRLSILQRPFIQLGVVLGVFVLVGVLINSMIHTRYENPDLHSSDFYGMITMLIFNGLL